MAPTRVLHTLLNCGHTIHHKKKISLGIPLYCNECREWVDTKPPAEMVAGTTYHPEYDCTTEPVLGSKGKYLTKCVKDGCSWTREATYHATMQGMHKHQTNSHSRWGNPMLTMEGF